MKHVLYALFALSLCLCSLGKDIDSHLGFTATIQDSWVHLSKEAADEKAVEFNKKIDQTLGPVDPAILSKVKEMLRVGNLALIFCLPCDPRFKDNINVMSETGKLPDLNGDLKELRKLYASTIGTAFGRKDMKFDKFDTVEVAGKRSIHLEYDGMGQGTRNIQYVVQATPEKLITFTFTYLADGQEGKPSEFVKFMASVKLKP